MKVQASPAQGNGLIGNVRLSYCYLAIVLVGVSLLGKQPPVLPLALSSLFSFVFVHLWLNMSCIDIFPLER